MNIVGQRIRNNFIQSLMVSDSKRATPSYRPYNNRRFTRPGRASAWWYNYIKKVVVPEESEKTRFNHNQSKMKTIVPPSNVYAKHFSRFLVWTQNLCSVFALKVTFLNLSGIMWTRPKVLYFLYKFYTALIVGKNLSLVAKNRIANNFLISISLKELKKN